MNFKINMNSKQENIAELLLKFLNQNDGVRNTDQLSYFFTKEHNYSWQEFSIVRDTLIEDGFVSRWGNEDYYIKLTSKGSKASEIGLNKFNEESTSNNQTYINSNINYGTNYGTNTVNTIKMITEPENQNHSTKKQHRQTIIISIIAILVTVIIALFQMYFKT
jgi:hypothetical protein